MSLVASAHVNGAVDSDAVPSQRTTGEKKIVDAAARHWRSSHRRSFGCNRQIGGIGGTSDADNNSRGKDRARGRSEHSRPPKVPRQRHSWSTKRCVVHKAAQTRSHYDFMTLLRIHDKADRMHDETICVVWHWRNKSGRVNRPRSSSLRRRLGATFPITHCRSKEAI